MAYFPKFKPSLSSGTFLKNVVYCFNWPDHFGMITFLRRQLRIQRKSRSTERIKCLSFNRYSIAMNPILSLTRSTLFKI